MSTPLINTIEIVERSLFHAIRKEVVDKGYLPDITLYPNTDVGVQSYNADLANIKANNGFAIEVFGVGSSQKKYDKKTPRIVIDRLNTLPGALGGSPGRIYTGIVNDNALSPESFRVSLMPPQSTDFTYSVILTYETAEQARILFQLLALALPKRGYITQFNNPVKYMFVKQANFYELVDQDKGTTDSVYTYTVEDIFEATGEDGLVDYPESRTIVPITEIKIDTRLGDSESSTEGPINTIE